MKAILNLVSSPWFWTDSALACLGGIIVFVGLKVEKSAEEYELPEQYHELFEEVVQLQKSRLRRGWRILMVGIVIEVVAAFIISVISGLEIEGAKENAAQANARAAGFDKARAALEKQIEEFRKANTELRIKLQPRRITAQQRENFIAFLKESPKSPVILYCTAKDMETIQYKREIKEMLEAAGYSIKNTSTQMEAFELEFPSMPGSLFLA